MTDLAEGQYGSQSNLEFLVLQLSNPAIEKLRNMIPPRQGGLTNLGFGLLVGGLHALPSDIDADRRAQDQPQVTNNLRQVVPPLHATTPARFADYGKP
jgi:hypothetical protein